MFVGGIDTHELLRTGTADEVRAAVRHNIRTLGPCYSVCPSTEAVQADVNDEMLLVMCDEARIPLS